MVTGSKSLYEQLSEERKQLQAEGKLPDWFQTGSWQMFKENYMYEADGYDSQVKRIAKHMASFAPTFLNPSDDYYERITKNFGHSWEECFYNVLWKGYLAPSSPVLANGGTNRGSPVSCSGQYVGDSIDSFYASRHEAALLTKEGFGTSAYLGGIRPRGSDISKGGKAEGTFPVLKGFTQDAKDVSQAGIRRGSWAGYIEIDHEDFDEWADHLHKNPQGLNIGWIVTRNFIAKLESGDEDSIRRYKKSLWVKMQTGKGYFWKVDHVNEQQPACYKDRGLTNKASNLCTEITLHSDEEHTYTCVLSSMNIFFFDEWKETGAAFVGMVFLDCVAEAFIQRCKDVKGLKKSISYTEKARSLGLGALGFHSYLQKNMLPFDSFDAHQKNTEIFKHLHDESLESSKWMAKNWGEPEWCKGYGVRNTHRCVTGDTKVLTKAGQLPISSLIGKSIDIWNGFEWSTVVPFETGVSEIYKVTFSNGMELKVTPDHKFLIATAKRESKGLFSNRTLEVETKNLRVGDCIPKFVVEATGSDKNLVNAYTAGVFCGDGSISNARAGKYPRNELRLYGEKMKLASKITWKSSSTWGGEDCVRGYLPDDILPKYVVPQEYSIKSKTEWLCGLIDSDGSAGSKGITISTRHKEFAIETALLIQSLGGDVRVLHSKVSGGFKPGSDIYIISISLFSCSKIFKDIKPYRVKVNTPLTKNKVGSLHFVEVVKIEKIPDHQQTYCFTETLKGNGVFNGILTKQCAVAPNMSSAVIAGQVSQGVEPIFANVFMQGTATGEMQRINPQFLKVMQEKGKYNKATIRSIIDKNGSVQHLDWLTPEEKEVFKTAFEIDQRSILRMASVRQRYIDQGQSLNLFFAAEESEEYIAQIHKEAFLDERIKGLYYIRTLAGVQAAKDECKSCEG